MSNNLTVYVVDDHEAVRDSLGALLDSVGLSVRSFASGREFLNAFEPSLRGCLLLDLRLPDINGIELQSNLTDLGSRLRTVMISGHGDVPLAVKAMQAGAVDFIEKPYTDELILSCVRRNLEECERTVGTDGTPEQVAARIDHLTPREHQVLEALVSGQPNKVIAHQLGISPRTVEIHRARVMSKMEARSLSHLVRMALAAGIETDPL
ncbi:MAG: response regulator FixJ [Rhodospirillales bacterium]|nr:response regulator FixJ [Rhodospirillales bacterium]